MKPVQLIEENNDSSLVVDKEEYKSLMVERNNSKQGQAAGTLNLIRIGKRSPHHSYYFKLERLKSRARTSDNEWP